MSRLIPPRRDLIVPSRHRQGGFLLNPYRFGAAAAPAYNTLLNFNGADASTTFTDDTGNHVWTAGGNAQIDTAQSKFGGASGLFDGTGDYISAPSHANWAMGTGDFTVGGWVRQPTGQQAGDRILFVVNVGNGLFIALRSGELTLGFEGVAYDHQGGGAITPDTWVHWEVGKASGTARGFINGVQVFSGANTRNFAQGVASFGGKTSGVSSLNGWLDSSFVLKGTCLHTGGFTPPAAPYSV